MGKSVILFLSASELSRLIGSTRAVERVISVRRGPVRGRRNWSRGILKWALGNVYAVTGIR